MSTTFTSDQTTLNKTTGAISLIRTGRTRITSIQGRGEAGSVLSLYDSILTGTPGTAVAIYRFDTEGLSVYVPGSGILCKTGVLATLTQTGGVDGSVTLTITGA
jgi:hypothetical protein